MLEFFRRHQRYFFLFTTIIIVISFSFFGTYGTMMQEKNSYDEIAFTTVDGSKIKRSDLEEMALFIGTDSSDKILFGGAWGPNFLNDGVIRDDVLSSGLAQQLLFSYPELVKDELAIKQQKEKRFAAYTHPQAKFLSLENGWSYFAPDIKNHFDALRKSDDPLSKEAIQSRVDLYLAAQKIPPQLMRQMLQYQERQYNWLSHDPALDRQDMAVFGYYTLNDWFGNKFVHLVSEFIINSAKLAEQRGYVVTKEEALASLWQNSERSFQENLSNPNLSVARNEDYFKEQLRRMHMDASKAVKIWQQVLLFRRLFSDAASSAFIDPLFSKDFVNYGEEKAAGTYYHLADETKIDSFKTLQLFETYLNAIAKRSSEDKNSLTVPTNFLKVEDIKKNTPELVQKRFLMDIIKVDKKNVQAKIGLKEIWNWEVDQENWKALQKKFPELAIKNSDDSTARFAALDRLDDVTRERVDNFARGAILDSHPEWTQEALDKAPYITELVSVRLKGGKSPLPGIEKREEFLALLEKADSNSKNDSEDNSLNYAEGNSFYRIKILDSSKDWEILNFDEAKKYESLNGLLNSNLENYYTKTRDTKEKEYQKEDKSWKALNEVKDQVAEDYFAKVIKALKSEQALQQQDNKNQTAASLDNLAALRLLPFVRAQYELIKEGQLEKSNLIDSDSSEQKEQKLLERVPLEKQWAIKRKKWTASRSEPSKLPVDSQQLFELATSEWSKVYNQPNGEIFFVQLEEKSKEQNSGLLVDKVVETQHILGNEVKALVALEVINLIKEKNSLSLDFLNKTYDYDEQEQKPLEIEN